MELSKVQFKVTLNDGESFSWIHFCYAPTEVKEDFDRIVNIDKMISNHWIEKWMLKEFGLVYTDDYDGFLLVKETIKDKYKILYPDFFLPSLTDSQGWLRVWYTNNMIEELAKRGK